MLALPATAPFFKDSAGKRVTHVAFHHRPCEHCGGHHNHALWSVNSEGLLRGRLEQTLGSFDLAEALSIVGLAPPADTEPGAGFMTRWLAERQQDHAHPTPSS